MRDLGRDGWRGWAARWGALGAAVAILAARVAAIYDRHLILDDAFISFRYADNLLRGLGLVYNAGERVEGYSNFLWTVLLAAGMRLGCEVERLSIGLSLAAALGTVGVVWAWACRLFAGGSGVGGESGDGGGGGDGGGVDGARGAMVAALPPLLYAAMGSQARYVVSGMETLGFGFLVVAAAYLLVARGRPLAAGGVFALAAMTRAVLYDDGYTLAVLARRRGEDAAGCGGFEEGAR